MANHGRDVMCPAVPSKLGGMQLGHAEVGPHAGSHTVTSGSTTEVQANLSQALQSIELEELLSD